MASGISVHEGLLSISQHLIEPYLRIVLNGRVGLFYLIGRFRCRLYSVVLTSHAWIRACEPNSVAASC